MNKILVVAITLTVGVILVGAVLSPVISDANKTLEADEAVQSNIENRMSKVDSFTIGWDSTNKVISVNGTTYPDMPSGKVLLVSDKMMIRSTSLNNVISLGIWAEGEASDSISNASKDITISLTDGDISFVHGSPAVTDTFTASYAYVYDENGDYAATQEGYTTSVKVNTGDNVVIFQNGAWWKKTYTPAVIVASPETITSTTVEYAASATTGTETDLTVEFEASDFDELTLVSCSPTVLSVIAPYEYTAYESNAYSELLNPIVLIVIVAILMVAVGAIMIRRE